MTSPDEPQTPRSDEDYILGLLGRIADLERQLELTRLEASGSRRIIDEMGVELRKAQGRCAKIEEALNLWNAGKITSDAFSYAVDAALAAIKP